MNQLELDMMKGMVSILNEASEAYYNTGNPIMSDEQFDMRLEDLRQFEEETGFILANSPTQNVGAKVLTELKEIEHNHPMLSLEKCHTVEEIIKFANNKSLVASIKLDGLTVSIKYENGFLVSAETRGNGYVGSDITEHIKQFSNVPMKVNKEGVYIVDGEAIITDEDFIEVNKDGEYKNSRNLASGTLSVLDTSLVAKRRLRFVVWEIIKGGCNNNLKDNLVEASELGFDVVPHWIANNLDPKKLQGTLDYIFDYASEEGLPNDGVVFKFDDIEYGKTLGQTSHHFKNGIAYKRKDKVYETRLLDIEWTMGRTGILTPTAIFEPVEIDGTTVERASLHNVSVMYDLYPKSWHNGLVVSVYKANQIIPQISKVEPKIQCCGKRLDPPLICPICHKETEIKQDNNSKVLVCTNPNCKGKLLGKLTHFVSKNAMNIDGMSESTLEKFINLGWIESFAEIYELKERFGYDITKLDGFGKKSVDKLFDAVEASKYTTLDRFIYSLSIPLIGRSASKDIAKYCDYSIEKFRDTMRFNYDYNNFINISGFGIEMCKSLSEWWKENENVFIELSKIFTFEKPNTTSNSNNLSNKVFVITGKLGKFNNRDEAKEKIENLGGKVSGSVSAKTSYLVNNDVASTSGKNKKAKELNIPIISEDELIEMLK